MNNVRNKIAKIANFMRVEPRTVYQISFVFGISMEYAALIVDYLRPQLFIAGWNKRPQNGQPVPRYSLMVSGDEVDAVYVKRSRAKPSLEEDTEQEIQRRRRPNQALSSRGRLLTRRLERIKAAETEEEKARLRTEFRSEDQRVDRARRRARAEYMAYYRRAHEKYGKKDNWPDECVLTLERIRSQDQSIRAEAYAKELEVEWDKVETPKIETPKLSNPFAILASYSSNQPSYQQKKAA